MIAALCFPGLLRFAANLDDPDGTIETARMHFEDGRDETADSLLAAAIEHSPRDASLRLAQLELAFLRRDVARFVVLAVELRRIMPNCADWKEIRLLGRSLAPAERLFA